MRPLMMPFNSKAFEKERKLEGRFKVRYELLHLYIPVTATIPCTPASTSLARVSVQVLCSCFPSDCHTCILKWQVPGICLADSRILPWIKSGKNGGVLPSCEKAQSWGKGSQEDTETGLLFKPCYGQAQQPQIAQTSCDCQLKSAQMAGQG